MIEILRQDLCCYSLLAICISDFVPQSTLAQWESNGRKPISGEEGSGSKGVGERVRE
jgi:hypothetical protein